MIRLRTLLLLSSLLLLTLACKAQTHTTVTVEDNQSISGQKQFLPGLGLGPIVFANLLTVPAQVDGTIVYVSDASNTNPCTGGGLGSFAQRVHGVWNCAIVVPNPLLVPGPIIQSGATSGAVTFQAQSTTQSWTFQWPTGPGVNGQCLATDGTGLTAWTTCGGGSGGTPGGLSGQLQYNNAGAFGGITNIALSGYLVSQGSGNVPSFQTKPVYDVRDWATCNTVVGASTGNNATLGILNLLSTIGSQQATIRILGSSNTTDTCLVDTINWPSNVTLDFSSGGALTLTTTITPPGSGVVDGSAAGSFNATTTSCSVTLSVPTAGDAVFAFQTQGFVSGGGVGLPTDTKGDLYRLVSTSNADPNHYANNTLGWVATNVASGSITITVPYTVATNNTCGAVAIKGLGPSVGADGIGGTSGNSSSSASPMTVTGSFTAGSFLISFGGNTVQTETCTAGSGFTQILNVGTNMNLCAQVQNSAAGGSVTATQAISPQFFANYWMYNIAGLKPIATTQFVQGGIFNPAKRQIFYQATSGPAVDFTGNTVIDAVYPEWWGASNTASATVNTAALQAAEHGAFGTNRTNSSGLQLFNKTLKLSSQYKINGELQFYHVIGTDAARATIDCVGGGGITQTAANDRIIDGQSVAYFQSKGCWWAGTTSSTAPLIDYDFSGAQGADLAPQFIDHYSDTFAGNGVVDSGVLIAKSGGGAQGSNIYCHNCESISFTGAAWQVGGNNTGRNAGRSYAQNAIAINYDGDIQGCTLYGMAVYGGGWIGFGSAARISTMENGFTSQTIGGADMYCEATQGPCVMEHMRSESLQLAAGSWLQIKNSRTINQAISFTGGTNSGAAGLFYQGSAATWDGAYYKVTTPGTFGGVAFSFASGGSSTSLTNTNQTIAGSVTQGTFGNSTLGDTLTQASTGSTAHVLNSVGSTGTITGSVTSGTIGAGHTMTQASTSVTCTSLNAPTGTASLTCNNFSGTADSSHIWTDGTTSGQYTPSAAPTFSVASPALVVTQATGSPDSSHVWTGTLGEAYTPTAVPANQANYSTNALNGQLLGILGGTGTNCMATITSNSAQTINFSGGFTTKYPQTLCPTPDTTSGYIVEPNWNHGTVTSGTAVLQYVNFDVIGPCNGCVGAIGRLEDVVAPGGKISFWSSPNSRSTIANLVTTRTDWLDQNDIQSGIVDHDWDVKVTLTNLNAPTFGGLPINWSYGAIGGTPFTGATHRDFGSKALCFNTGTIGNATPSPGNTSANEVCVGGRSYQGLGTDAFVQRLEVAGGGIGPPTPFGTNLNGNDFPVLGGASTGSGTPGSILFKLGSTGSSGTSPNTGSTIWKIDGPSGGNLLTAVDNTYDIGTSGTNRPRDLWLGRDANIGRDVNIPRQYSLTETTAPSTSSGIDQCYGDSSLHAQKCSYNNGGFFKTPQIIAQGSTALGTSSISSGACATVITVGASGVLTTDVVSIGFNGDPTGVIGYIPSSNGTLYIVAYPTVNSVNFKVCNNTASPITPGALTINWQVPR